MNNTNEWIIKHLCFLSLILLCWNIFPGLIPPHQFEQLVGNSLCAELTPQVLLTVTSRSRCCWQWPVAAGAAGSDQSKQVLLTVTSRSRCCWQWLIATGAADSDQSQQVLLTVTSRNRCCWQWPVAAGPVFNHKVEPKLDTWELLLQIVQTRPCVVLLYSNQITLQSHSADLFKSQNINFLSY